MNKTIFAFGLIFLALGLIIYLSDIGENKIVVVKSNKDKVAIEITEEQVEKGKYLCSETSIPIFDLYNTAQVVLPNGNTHFFLDVGNMFLWINNQKYDKKDMKIWVYTQDTGVWVDGRGAWYSRVDTTPLAYGFGAYEYKFYGIADFYFEEVELYALRGETLWNPYVKNLIVRNKI